jgi:hypothetical protein
MTRRTTIATSLILGLGLAGLSEGQAGAQTRVIVPIVIQAPRTAAPPAVQITTRTVSPQPGVTRTDVTVQNTTGVQGFSSAGRSRLQAGETRVTVQDATGVLGFSNTRRSTLQPGESRVTVRDTTGVSGFASNRSSMPPPGGTVTHLTLQDKTGTSGFASARLRALPPTTPAPGPLPAPGDGGSSLVVPFPVTLGPAVGGSQSLTITTEGPIDAPIVILGQ